MYILPMLIVKPKCYDNILNILDNIDWRVLVKTQYKMSSSEVFDCQISDYFEHHDN